MAIFLPVFVSAGCGATQPSSKARSAMAHSMVLMVTGLSSMLSVHEDSHGAGQTRPVTSGKVLVACRLSADMRQRWRNTWSLQSELWLFTGQPVSQWGLTQSMQGASDVCSS